MKTIHEYSMNTMKLQLTIIIIITDSENLQTAVYAMLCYLTFTCCLWLDSGSKSMLIGVPGVIHCDVKFLYVT